MDNQQNQNQPEQAVDPKKFFKFLGNYKLSIFVMLIFTVFSNVTTLIIPGVAANAIDAFAKNSFNPNEFMQLFAVIVIAIFIFTILQNFLGVFIAERVGRDLREKVSNKVSKLSFKSVNKLTPERLLTNMTSDINAIKQFISEAAAALFSSILLLIGSAILLLKINFGLGIVTLSIVPILAVVFMVIFSKLESTFKKAQENIDKLNRTISENILGSALIRVLNSRKFENKKFDGVNSEAREIGTTILNLFASFFPIITVVANLAVLFVLYRGGTLVINGELSIGDFSAFYTYIGILIFPIIMIGFISSGIARTFTSYGRISEVLEAEEDNQGGDLVKEITGNIELKNVNYSIDEKEILKDISFDVKAKSRTAIIGPTASGKSQILNIITGLIQPTSGEVLIDGTDVNKYKRDELYRQIGMVFQDSILFNTTIRENIQFSDEISDADLNKAIETAELDEFVTKLPKGVETKVSERGSSLSGGQKQRLTLARALVLNPKILLLDDFTARVDNNTEQRIFENLKKNYPDTTVIMITQKISSVKEFDQIVLLMEGEILAKGTHKELLKNSVEYKLIYDSQQSTE